MIQPDGQGTSARIGVLVPHKELVVESEFAAMAPPGVSIHTARVPLGVVREDPQIQSPDIRTMVSAFAKPPGVDDAVALLAAAPLDVIVFAFTSSSYLLGANADAALKERLEKNTNNIPVVVQGTAAVAALRALGCRKPTLIHPPWWPNILDEWAATYFRDQGFDLTDHKVAKIPSCKGEVDAVELALWIEKNVSVKSDSVFLGGSGFRTIGILELLESKLNRPVISSNQAAFWYSIQLTGIPDNLVKYGKLFRTTLS